MSDISEAEIDIEYQNILSIVRTGQISEHEGFDYYKAFRDGDMKKVEAMRKLFQERLNKSWDCHGF